MSFLSKIDITDYAMWMYIHVYITLQEQAFMEFKQSLYIWVMIAKWRQLNIIIMMTESTVEEEEWKEWRENNVKTWKWNENKKGEKIKKKNLFIIIEINTSTCIYLYPLDILSFFILLVYS